MLRVLCLDGIRLIIGDFRMFVELSVRLLVNVAPGSILYLHLLLRVQSAIMRLGFRRLRLDGITHVGLVLAAVISG